MLKRLILIVSIIIFITSGAIAASKYVHHQHQFHPSPVKNHTDTGINPYHPYFHQHNGHGIHQHGTKYGHSKYKNYRYMGHYFWKEWREQRHCYPDGVYRMDDDDVMTMYSYCKSGSNWRCYSMSISDPPKGYK